MSQKAKATLVLPVDPLKIDDFGSQASLREAAEILRGGGTVAFPTETVYGLGASAFSAEAVQKIFAAKQRPSWDPLIVHIAGRQMLDEITSSVSVLEQALMQQFWPGPLTLLLQRSESVPLLVSAGRPKIGVRMPAHPVARALIERAGLPIAAPSANSFGRTSPTTAQHVLEDLDGRIDAILDGGPTALGLESTVIDVSVQPPTLYRHGMISFEELRRLVPDLVAYQAATASSAPESLPSPGVGLRHYAPRARLILVEGHYPQQALMEGLAGLTDQHVGIMLPDDCDAAAFEHAELWRWGRWTHPEELAQRLFAGLRALDALNVSVIFCPLPGGNGIGAALRDRLRKAAKPADSRNQ